MSEEPPKYTERPVVRYRDSGFRTQEDAERCYQSLIPRLDRILARAKKDGK
jgi:hypothetical protein